MTSSSRGLLPQLVDLLHAMADSQELLIRRIRKAQLELLGGPPSGVDGSLSTLPLDPPRPHSPSLIGTTQAPASELQEPFCVDNGRSTIAPSKPFEASSTPNEDPETSRVTHNHRDLTTPPNAITAGTTSVADHDSVEKAMSKQPSDVEATGRDATFGDPGNPNYNFFDELDARLADLRSSENGSEKS